MDAKGKKVRNRIESHDFSGRLSVGDHGEDAVFLGVLAVVLAPRRTEGLCKNAKKNQFGTVDQCSRTHNNRRSNGWPPLATPPHPTILIECILSAPLVKVFY